MSKKQNINNNGDRIHGSSWLASQKRNVTNFQRKTHTKNEFK